MKNLAAQATFYFGIKLDKKNDGSNITCLVGMKVEGRFESCVHFKFKINICHRVSLKN